MAKQRVLCTGNPQDPATIASGIKELFPTADFASRTTGYDLTFTKPGSKEYFCNNLKKYNILINASYIAPGVQQHILQIANETWRHGHVVNIGSTAEYDINAYPNREYAADKLALRDLSLRLFSYRFRTTHIVLGGICSTEHPDWLKPTVIAETVSWAVNSPVDVPIVGIQQEFEPW